MDSSAYSSVANRMAARPFMSAAIAERRLRNQFITRVGLRRAADVVAWFGAIQAQEYEAAKWALGLRMRNGASEAEIERAFEDGLILRTHVMRPTWHFVTPADIRWLVTLTAPRVRRVMSSYNRRLELDTRTLTRAIGVIERALGDRRCLTRTELSEHLNRAGLAMAGQRLAHVMMDAELEGIICSGPRRGKKFTYALVAERAPAVAPLSRDEALATLSRRFFSSHAPATIRDFVWWSGLTTAEAKRSVDIIGARREDLGGKTYWTIGHTSRGTPRNHLVQLLPIYDEYLIAYRDRDAVPHGPWTVKWGSPGAVNFHHALVIAGRVAGTWRVTRSAQEVLIHATPLRRLTRVERRALTDAVHRYERFLSVPVQLSI
jgi:winged helix DNA-binding protein